MLKVMDTAEAERTIADPAGDTVDSGAAGDGEERAHDLREQRADELEQAEVEQQREQQAGEQEDDDEHGEQVAEHKPTRIGVREHPEERAFVFGADAQVDQPDEDGTENADCSPDRGG